MLLKEYLPESRAAGLREVEVQRKLQGGALPENKWQVGGGGSRGLTGESGGAHRNAPGFKNAHRKEIRRNVGEFGFGCVEVVSNEVC
jgi:hypothetical protein